MDERRQYVPTSTYTYPASPSTIGIRQETIVREASDKETDYKNVKDVPVESVEAPINNDKPREWYENL
jgi:hypothetical protein